MKLDINYKKKKLRKIYKHMEVKNALLNNLVITEEIKEEIKKKTSDKIQHPFIIQLSRKWTYGKYISA